MGSYANAWWFVFLIFLLCNLQVNCKKCWIGSDIAKTKTTTTSGELMGTIRYIEDIRYEPLLKFNEFLGVPYAKPPIGDLRFRRPVKIENSQFTQVECFCQPNPCVQSISSPWQWPWRLEDDQHMGEDCLYMNIWAPASDEKKSVLFYIHGGGVLNATGSASDTIYNGQELSTQGNIIVVVPNYRIGTLGFWSTRYTSNHPVLSELGRAPGNLALWDIITALEWVYDNIENFGGDRDNITVDGQGFGSVIASLLPITYEASGLFKRLILQSGTAMWQHNKPISYNLDVSMDIAEMMGCAGKDVDVNEDEDKIIDCMLKKDAKELAEAEMQTDRFFPVWGDDLLPHNPRGEILRNHFNIDELLIGYNDNEGIEMFLDLHPGEKVFQSQSQYKESPPIYRTDETDWRFNQSINYGYLTVVCPAIYYAQRSMQAGTNVYFYHFQHRPKNTTYTNWIYVNTFDEVAYIFGVPRKNKRHYTENEVRMSQMMMGYWSHFVKEGIPSRTYKPFDSCDFYKILTFHDSIAPENRSRHNLMHACDWYREQYEEIDV